jgi:hypothetical protein
MSALQCPKLLWFRAHHPELEEFTASTQSAFNTGNAIGEIARDLYAAPGAVLIDYEYQELDKALAETQRRLAAGHRAPIFEATFQHDGVLVRVDALVPSGESAWRLVEVKASARLKAEHLPDCAVQAWVCRGLGLAIDGVALAHVDNQFEYQGDGDYAGLLTEEDVTDQVESLLSEVPAWIAMARKAVTDGKPAVEVGAQCTKPYPCSFFNQCWPADAEYPVHGLKGSKQTLAGLVNAGYRDIRDVPAAELTDPGHRRIHRVTTRGAPEVLPGAAQAIAALGYPRYYLDFETIAPAIPIWPGTRPYAAVPVQWSIHIEHADGSLAHHEFLDLSGEPPMRDLAEQMLAALGDAGPVLMYTPYEEGVIRGLADRYPDLAGALRAVIARLWDLHPVVKQHYYHPDMLGSWSIKDVIRTLPNGFCYEDLEEIQEGTAASNAYLEAIDPETSVGRKAYLRERLLEYCRVDTEAMVRIVHFLEERLS